MGPRKKSNFGKSLSINQGTISIVSNPLHSGRNVHVHARYFYVRDLVYDNSFVNEKLPTGLHVADIGCTFKGSHTFISLKRFLMNCARIPHDAWVGILHHDIFTPGATWIASVIIISL
jgi:hypothetical protein